MVEGSWRESQPPLAGSLCPPSLKGELRAGIDHPVQHRERDVGPHRCTRIAATATDDVIDDVCDLEASKHLPHRSDVAEGEVTSAVGHHGRATDRRFDIGRFAQVSLRDDLRFAAHSGNLSGVVVRMALDGLADDRCHVLGHTPCSNKTRASDQDKRAGQRLIWKKVRKGPKRGSRDSQEGSARS